MDLCATSTMSGSPTSAYTRLYAD
ncbi:uncharacterized protein METZ01_LOCUS302479, partial [marine metagenome]